MKNLHHLAIPAVLVAVTAATGCKKDKEEIFYGDDASYQVQAKGNGDGVDNDIAGPHNPSEPADFSAGWVGQETYEVLQSARRGELPYSQVRSPSGAMCLLFHQDRLVRRLMIGSGRQNDPTQELTFSQSGSLLLWFRSDRRARPTFDWAYFHRNSRLALYQVQTPGGPRTERAAPDGFAQSIFDIASGCLTQFGASNPTPGTYFGPPAAAPAPVPQPVPVAVQPLPAQPAAGFVGGPVPVAVNPTPVAANPTPVSRPAAPSQPACSGNEVPCNLRDGRTGWCKGGTCKDICGAGLNYSPMDTECHKRCTKSCKNCQFGLCFD